MKEMKTINQENLIMNMTKKDVKKRVKMMTDTEWEDLMMSERVQEEYVKNMKRLTMEGDYEDEEVDEYEDDSDDHVMNDDEVEWIQRQNWMNEDMDDRIGEEGRRRIREGREERRERRKNQQRMRQKVSRSLAEATLNVLKRAREDDDSSSEDSDDYSEEEKEFKKKERRGRPKKKKKKKREKKKKKRMRRTDDSLDEDDDEEEAEDSEDDEDEDDDEKDAFADPFAEKELVPNWEEVHRLQSNCFVWVLQRYDEVLKHKSVLWIAQMIEWASATKIKVRWWTSIPEEKKKKQPGRPKKAPGPKQLTWGPWRETKQENVIKTNIVKLVIELNPSGTIKGTSREKIQDWMRGIVLPMWLADLKNDYERKKMKMKDEKHLKTLKNEYKNRMKQLSETVLTAMDSDI